MNDGASETYDRLINASLRFVSIRPRSVKEIRDFLQKTLTRWHMSAPQVSEKVINRLIELGYANDDAFTQWFVTQRTGRKPKGQRAIAIELKQKGVHTDTIDRVISQYFTHEVSERDLAKKALETKLRIWGNLPKLVQKQKLSQFLMRRGFSGDVVWSLVDEEVENR
jgi:regulatory protein